MDHRRVSTLPAINYFRKFSISNFAKVKKEKKKLLNISSSLREKEKNHKEQVDVEIERLD